MKQPKFLNIEGPPEGSVFNRPLIWCMSADVQRKLQKQIDATLDHIAKLKDDRLLVLVGNLLIENAIDEFLAAFIPKYKHLRDNRDVTFSIRIQLARAFELCPTRFFACADVIRKIRNEFAHNLDCKAFADLPPHLLDSLHTHLSEFEAHFGPKKDAAVTFRNCVSFLTMALWVYRKHVSYLNSFIRSKDVFRPLKSFLQAETG